MNELPVRKRAIWLAFVALAAGGVGALAWWARDAVVLWVGYLVAVLVTGFALAWWLHRGNAREGERR